MHAAAVVAQDFALLTQVLRVLLALVRDVQAIGLLQRTLFVRIHVDVALDTFLSHVGPGVSTHPLPFAFGAFVLSEASLFPLIGCQSFTFGTGLRAVFDVMSLIEAEMAQVVWWRSLAGLAWLRGQGEVGKVVR